MRVLSPVTGLGVVLVSLVACGGNTTQNNNQSNQNSSGGHQDHADGGASRDAAGDAGPGPSAVDGGVAATSDAGFTRPTGAQAAQITQLFQDGSAAYGRGDLQAAADAFRRAYELYPSPELAFNVGRVYERMGSVDEAIRYYQLILNGTPAPSADTRADLEKRIDGLHQYEQRRRDGIAQPPPTADATQQEGVTWLTRGISLYRRRQYPQALIAFETAQNYLDTPELYFNLAVTHEALGNYDRALAFMQQYLRTRQGTAEESYVQDRIRQIQAHLRQ